MFYCISNKKKWVIMQRKFVLFFEYKTETHLLRKKKQLKQNWVKMNELEERKKRVEPSIWLLLPISLYFEKVLPTVKQFFFLWIGQMVSFYALLCSDYFCFFFLILVFPWIVQFFFIYLFCFTCHWNNTFCILIVVNFDWQHIIE